MYEFDVYVGLRKSSNHTTKKLATKNIIGFRNDF